MPPTPALLTSTSTTTVGLVEDAREAGAHRLVVGDVELDEVDLDPGVGRHRLQLGRLVDAADSAVDVVALLGEVDGGGAADAAVGAGDDGDGHAAMVSRCALGGLHGGELVEPHGVGVAGDRQALHTLVVDHQDVEQLQSLQHVDAAQLEVADAVLLVGRCSRRHAHR